MTGDKRTEVWSCGGGVQSTAIACAIILGKLPKPDIAAIVDTGREKSSTFEYLNAYTIPALREVGVEMQIVHKDRYATVDLYSTNGDRLLLPAMTRHSGKLGKLPTYCSNEWKQRVMKRFLRDVGVEACRMWLGISTDEMKRVRVPREQWCDLRYPLIFDYPMNRTQCVKLVKDLGWPDPPRSSCWMCPNMTAAEWKHEHDALAGDFAKAIQLEKEIQGKDPTVYLHLSGQPLTEVNFDDTFVGLDGGCDSGMCFV